MLSSLPKLADRAFILGTFLPTLLFTIVLLLEFRDVSPASDWLAALTSKELGQAAYVILAVWVIAVVLSMLNTPLYRLLEGYSFPHWLAAPLKRRQRRRLKAILIEIKKLHARWAVEGPKFPVSDRARYSDLRSERSTWLPPTKQDLLPTRFGNAIKAFEVYPREIYGADGVTIWLRLTAVIPKSFIDQIAQSRTQVDFLINSFALSCIVAGVGLARTVCSASWHELLVSGIADWPPFLHSIQTSWLLWVAGGLVGAWASYEGAVNCVPDWGDLVRTAFDCYLPSLAKQLGFELPATEKRRMRFWTTFSQQAIYQREPNGSTPFRVETWLKTSPPLEKVDQVSHSDASVGKQGSTKAVADDDTTDEDDDEDDD